MGYNNRYDLLKSDTFKAQCEIALADWLNYWATNGTGSIEDPDLREKTDMYIKFCVINLDTYTQSLATLVIGEPNIISAEEITDGEIRTAVTHVLSTALDYLI